MLDRHPELCSGPETKLFVPAAFNLDWLASAYQCRVRAAGDARERQPSQGAFIDAFAGRVIGGCAARPAGPRRRLTTSVTRLDPGALPGGSVVHIIRDGRDVVCSMREHPDWRWVDGAWHKVVVARPLEWYARRWLADTAAGMARRRTRATSRCATRTSCVDPEQAMRGICEDIGAFVDEAWLGQVAAGDVDVGAAHDAIPSHGPTTTARPVESPWGAGRRTSTPTSSAWSRGSAGIDCAELGYEA